MERQKQRGYESSPRVHYVCRVVALGMWPSEALPEATYHNMTDVQIWVGRQNLPLYWRISIELRYCHCAFQEARHA